MAETRKLSINFYLVIIASLIGGLLKAAMNDGGLVNYRQILTNAYSLGTILGYAISVLVIGFIIALAINFIFNLFRKEKKHFSYVWIWLFIIIYFIGSAAYSVHEAVKDTPELRKHFMDGCVSQAKIAQKYDDMNADDQQQSLAKINEFCDKTTKEYFQFYDQCMDEKYDYKICVKQAQFQECMKFKQDNDYCQKLSEQNPT